MLSFSTYITDENHKIVIKITDVKPLFKHYSYVTSAVNYVINMIVTWKSMANVTLFAGRLRKPYRH